MQFTQHRLAAKFLPLVVELDSLQLTGSRGFALPQAADEEASLPAREAVTGIERAPGHCDRGHPDDGWRLEVLTPWVLGDLRSHVVPPVAHVRPAVIRASLEDVDLVAAVGPLL